MKAVILGDAAGVHDDFRSAMAVFRDAGAEPDAIAATNNIGIDWTGHLDYWATLHPLPCRDWPGMEDALARRLKAGRNRPQTWAYKPGRGVDRSTSDWGGSTGLFTVKVLLEEGFTRIVLAGVPLTQDPHYYDDRPWAEAKNFRSRWLRNIEAISPYVRSMSGWTAEILGEPTAEWLNTGA